MMLLNSWRFGASIDVTPAAVNWTGGSATTTDPTGRVWSDAKQITGINQTINLFVYTGSGDWTAGTVKAWICDTEFGVYTEAATGSLGDSLSFLVAPNKWVKYSFDGATTKGIKSGIVNFVVQNATDSYVTLDSNIPTELTVDSGDVFGYDYTPNPVSFPDANLNIASTTAAGSGTSPVSAVLSGTEKPIQVTPVLDVQTGGANVTASLLMETSADGSTGWVSHGSVSAINGVDGYGSPFIWPMGHTLRITSSATTPDGVARAGSYALLLYNENDGAAVIDTINYSVALNQPP